MRRFEEEDFKALLVGPPPRRITEPVEMPPDFWAYFDRIPAPDFEGFRCTGRGEILAFRTGDGKHDLVHIQSEEDGDVFMVLVVDLSRPAVAGHRLMDFRREYGLRASG